MSVMNAKDILLRAADHLDEVGLYKGYYYDKTMDEDEAPKCAVGALNFVMTGRAAFPDAPVFAVARVLDDKLPGRQNVVGWSDSASTTLEDVTTFMRSTAESL